MAIHGGDPHAFLQTGERLHRGQSLMRVRVSTPEHSGLRLRFTCPSGAVTGYGYEGADALAVNGRRILSQHTVRPKVQAAADRNHDGRFTARCSPTARAAAEPGHARGHAPIRVPRMTTSRPSTASASRASTRASASASSTSTRARRALRGGEGLAARPACR